MLPIIVGSVAERFKAVLLKSTVGYVHREFESHRFRKIIKQICIIMAFGRTKIILI